MRQTKVREVRRWGMVAALMALAVGTGAANAAVIKATWDPAYGAAFLGLAFTGEAQFYVPDACLSGPTLSSPTFIADGATCSTGDPNGAGISLRSAFVDLYTFTGVYSTGNRTYQETLTYASPLGLYGSTVTPDPLLGVVVQNGSVPGQYEVIGASSLPIGEEDPADSDITAIVSFTAFYMRLGPGPVAPADGAPLSESDAALYKESRLFPCEFVVSGDYESRSCPVDLTKPSNPATVVFSRVPEPGSLALVFGALAAGWAARRSRRQVEPASC